MAARLGVKIPRTVTTPRRPSFALGTRPPDLYAPRMGSRPSGDISKPPRITPMPGQRAYGKQSQQPGFGDTGLTGES